MGTTPPPPLPHGLRSSTMRPRRAAAIARGRGGLQRSPRIATGIREHAGPRRAVASDQGGGQQRATREAAGLVDMHILTETLTFREEYTEDRTHDNGAQHRADIALRFYDKVRRVIA